MTPTLEKRIGLVFWEQQVYNSNFLQTKFGRENWKDTGHSSVGDENESVQSECYGWGGVVWSCLQGCAEGRQSNCSHQGDLKGKCIRFEDIVYWIFELKKAISNYSAVVPVEI